MFVDSCVNYGGISALSNLPAAVGFAPSNGVCRSRQIRGFDLKHGGIIEIHPVRTDKEGVDEMSGDYSICSSEIYSSNSPDYATLRLDWCSWIGAVSRSQLDRIYGKYGQNYSLIRYVRLNRKSFKFIWNLGLGNTDCC